MGSQPLAPCKFPPLTMSTLEVIRSTAQHRWFKNNELVDLLQNFASYGFTVAMQSVPSPPLSGSINLFSKYQVRRWRQDGHEWKKKRDGKNIKEHHEKLKVKGIELINCCYAHHETIDGFHRRGYWLLSRPHIVLVHYLQQNKDGGLVSIPQSTVSIPGVVLQSHEYSKEVPAHFNRGSRLSPYSSNPMPIALDTASFDTKSCGSVGTSPAVRKCDSARFNRDRKKVYTDTLNQTITEMTAQIAALELEVPRQSTQEEDKNRIIQELRSCTNWDVKNESMMGDGRPSVQSLVDEWFKLSKSLGSKDSATESLHMAARMLAPGSQAKFAMWGLDRDQACLWSSLLEDGFLTNEKQIKQLQMHRPEALRLRDEFLSLAATTKSIASDIESIMSSADSALQSFRDVFPPQQLALGLLTFHLNDGKSAP